MLSFLFNLSKATWHQKLYMYGLYVSYVLFFIALTGIVSISPDYISTLETAMKYYVCAFLIIRFNPLVRKEKVGKEEREFDRRIAYNAGIFLLLTTAFTSVAESYLGPLHKSLT